VQVSTAHVLKAFSRRTMASTLKSKLRQLSVLRCVAGLSSESKSRVRPMGGPSTLCHLVLLRTVIFVWRRPRPHEWGKPNLFLGYRPASLVLLRTRGQTRAACRATAHLSRLSRQPKRCPLAREVLHLRRPTPL